MSSVSAKVLEIKDLQVRFDTEDGVVKAVEDVNLDLFSGEMLGVVGETGCGKSVTLQSVLRLLPTPPTRITRGQILFHGENLLDVSEERMNEIRGGKIAMIFQEPMTSLNPVFTIGEQMRDVIEQHRRVGKRKANSIAIRALIEVGLEDAEVVLSKYPHELSGGQRQRVMIAMALSCQPEILIADEPTTALDVSIQAQILAIIKHLRQTHNMSVLLVTHNLGVVAQTCDRVAVMYAGYVVEKGEKFGVLKAPLHPYTRGLLESIPRSRKVRELRSIPGSVPNLIDPPEGCRFHPRCSFATEVCKREVPILEEAKPGHFVACHHWRRLGY